jgi:hypothetical protein
MKKNFEKLMEMKSEYVRTLPRLTGFKAADSDFDALVFNTYHYVYQVRTIIGEAARMAMNTGNVELAELADKIEMDLDHNVSRLEELLEMIRNEKEGK